MAHDDAKRLWQQFAALTDEMRKFLTKEDIDAYLELERQRNVFYERIQSLDEDDYRVSDEGKSLFERLKPIEESMIRDAQSWVNKSRANNTKVQEYGQIGSLRAQGNLLSKNS